MRITIKTKCSKCNGAGKLAHFKHVANGECFTCRGTGSRTASIDACNAFKGACVQAAPASGEVDMLDFFLNLPNTTLCPAA